MDATFLFMDVFYEKIMRPILFTQNPEFAHDMALKAMQVVSAVRR